MNEVRWINTALLLMFVYLKLSRTIDWSWWWVTAPFWIPLALWLTVTLCQAIYIGWFESPADRNNRELRESLAALSRKLGGKP